MKINEPPYDYVREDERRLVYVRAHRTLTAADVAALLYRQIHDAAWAYGVLYDLRMTDAPTSTDDAVKIAGLVSELVTTYGPRGPVALVTKDDAMRAAPEIHARHAGPAINMQVFLNFTEAKQWLTGQWRASSRGVQ